MSIAVRHTESPLPELEPLRGLRVREECDAARMAALQARPLGEIARRFAAGHRAYVASYEGQAAAFGWVATRVAAIGELGATVALGANERYLWNFVTLPQFRGLGIYPRLLQAIMRIESRGADTFWIAYAPENRASAAGIHKAGFVTVADLSFDARGAAAIRARESAGAAASRVFNLPVKAEPLAPCWRCVRAGQPAMGCAPGSCRCDYQRPDVECAA